MINENEMILSVIFFVWSLPASADRLASRAGQHSFF